MNKIIKIIFIIYLTILFITLIRFEAIGSLKNNIIDMVPFNDYVLYPNVRDVFQNIFGNIIIFMPFGMYLSLISMKEHTIRYLPLIVLSSLTIEMFQFLLKSGYADIDDIIFNSIGGLLGILLTDLFYHISPKWTIRFILSISFLFGIPVILIFIKYYII